MVSVIIPAYNYGRYLGGAIESVMAQTYRDWECIIIDNGSSDNTADVVRAYQADPRIRYFYQENRGVSSARNRGLGLSKGEFVQFLDADDLIAAEKFEASLRAFEQFPSTDVCYSDVRYFRAEFTKELFFTYQCETGDGPWMKYVSGAGKTMLDVLISGNNFVISSPVFRKSLLNTLGGFDPNLGHNEDWDFWLRAALAGAEFRYVSNERAQTHIRVHHNSASRNILKMQASGLLVLKKNEEALKAAGLGKAQKRRKKEHVRAIYKSLAVRRSAALMSEDIRMLKSMGLFPELSAEAKRPLWLSRLFMNVKAMLS